jgi:hypothetical protein
VHQSGTETELIARILQSGERIIIMFDPGFTLHQRVRLCEDVPGLGIRAGMLGTIRGVISVGSHRYYEVEVQDSLLESVRVLLRGGQLQTTAPLTAAAVAPAKSLPPLSPHG